MYLAHYPIKVQKYPSSDNISEKVVFWAQVTRSGFNEDGSNMNSA